MEQIDWKHIAVQLYRADGYCHLLTTPERDALLAAFDAAPGLDLTMPFTDALAHGADVGAIMEAGRTLAAAGLGEHLHPFTD